MTGGREVGVRYSGSAFRRRGYKPTVGACVGVMLIGVAGVVVVGTGPAVARGVKADDNARAAVIACTALDLLRGRDCVGCRFGCDVLFVELSCNSPVDGDADGLVRRRVAEMPASLAMCRAHEGPASIPSSPKSVMGPPMDHRHGLDAGGMLWSSSFRLFIAWTVRGLSVAVATDAEWGNPMPEPQRGGGACRNGDAALTCLLPRR